MGYRNGMSIIAGRIVGFFSRLRFPYLAALTGLLFVANLFIPDAIPFIDEILLGLGTALFASWRKRDDRNKPQETEPPAA